MADGVELATGYVSLVIAGDKIAPGVKRALGQAEGEADKAGKASGKRFSSAFGGGLKLLGGAAIGAGIVSGFNSTVNAASDLNETVNKSTVIFGKNAAQIDRWASSADRNLGLSKQAALEAAAGFGDMFSQIGFGDAQAAKLSKSVVQMSADLGSFNNLGTDEVADRLSAAFRGEYDSLQALIPNINAARVEHEALAKTGKKTAKELTAAEKASAVLAIVQKDGARAAGDFARTSDGLANSKKIEAAATDNLKAKIGSGLLPIQMKATRFLADEAIPAISDFVDGMQNGTGAGGDFADILEDVGGALKTTFEVGKDLVGVFNDLPGPVKKFGAEGLIALAVFSKLGGIVGPASLSVKAFAAELSTAEGRMGKVTTASQALGGALRATAGAGGMVLLAQSTQETNKELSSLEAVAGGALSGAALGAFAGPAGAAIGGAIGGLAGGMLALSRNTDDAGGIARVSIGDWSAYSETLDDVTGSVTGLSKKFIFLRLQESHVLDVTKALGISDKEAIRAAQGNAKAREHVTAAVKGHITALDAQITAQRNALQAVPNNADKKTVAAAAAANKVTIAKIAELQAQKALNQATLDSFGAIDKEVSEKKRQIIATEDLTKVYKGLPKKAITEIGQKGGALTRAQIIDLTSRYDSIDDRDVETLLGVNNLPNTLADIRQVNREADLAARDRTLKITITASTNALLADRDVPPYPGGRDGNPNTAYPRVLGGPVTAGQPYIVGEKRPELFIPNQSGRIIPRVPQTSTAASGPVSLAGQRLALMIGNREIEGVIVEIADSRVDSHAAMLGETDRAL